MAHIFFKVTKGQIMKLLAIMVLLLMFYQTHNFNKFTTRPIPENKLSMNEGDDMGNADHHVLLISSIGRSGSTFLGEVLASPPKVFYLFEPLNKYFKGKMVVPQSTMVSKMQNLLTCNFTEHIKHSVLSWPSVLHFMRIKGMKNPSMELDKYCLDAQIRMLKTIRTRVSSLYPFFKLYPNLKVVHLLRDPRGSLLSFTSTNMVKSMIPIKTSCSLIEDDLYHGKILAKQYPKRYIAVRYEDICDDPWTIVEGLFNFIGYPHLHNDTIRYLKKHTTKNYNYAFGTQRITENMKQKWRSQISQELLTQVENDCRNIIKTMGFNLFGSINAARNLTFPLDSKPSYNFIKVQ